MVKELDNCKTVEQLENYIEYCLHNWELFNEKERKSIVVQYVEKYYSLTERQPRDSRLSALADFLLVEILTDSHPDKVTRTEYPIFSNKQVFRRRMKTVLSDSEDTIDFLSMRYNSYKAGQEGQTRVHRRITTNRGE